MNTIFQSGLHEFLATSSPATTAWARDLHHLPLHGLTLPGPARHADLDPPRHALQLRRARELHHPEPAADACHIRRPARARLAGARPGCRPRRCSFKDGFGNVVHLVTINAPARRTDHRGRRHGRDRATATASSPGSPSPRRRASSCKETPQTTPDAAIRDACCHPSTGKEPLERLHALLGRRPRSGRLRAGRHRRSHERRRGARRRQGRVPGPRARLHLRGAHARRPGPLRHGLSGAGGRRRAVGGAPRLGGGLGGERWAGSASTSPTASAPPTATCASPPASMPAMPPPSSARAAAGHDEKFSTSAVAAVQQQQRPAQ